MKKVYRNSNSETALTNLYDKQLARLNIEFEDLYVDTRFGLSHVIIAGNKTGKPVLLFHGGNSTAPYYLAGFKRLLEHFCVYSVDTIGHPGKSAQTVLSARSMDYGLWASDVITALGFSKVPCIGGSFGGGVLLKLMCVSPEKVEKSVLIVPSGLANITTLNVLFKMGVPTMLYIITNKDYWLKKTLLLMAMDENNIDGDTYEMVESSFKHAVIKAGLPSNVPHGLLAKCSVPTLLIAAENDCLFPGEKVIERAREIWPNLDAILLHGQGHLCVLPDPVINKIIALIAK